MAKIDFDIDRLLDKKLIDSMNEQMQPSDEVVSGLLSKIAELEASEVRAEAMKTVEVKEKVRGFRAVPKRFWYYSSAIAASVVLLVATFTAIGGDGIDKIKAAFNNVVNVNIVSENQQDIVKTDDTKNQNNEENAQLNNEQAVITDTDVSKDNSKKDSKSDKKNNKKDKNKDKQKDTNPVDENQNGEQIQTDNPDAVNNPEQNIESQEGQLDAQNPNDVDTQGEDAQGNIEGQGEDTDPLLSTVLPPAENEEPLEVMTIEGNNYIVGSTAKTATLSEESSVSLEVPTTTGSAKKLQVKSLKSVSPNLMMAVMPDEGHEDEPAMLYTNADYVPENLGQFIEDADINSASEYGMIGGDGIVIRIKSGVRKNFKAGDTLESSLRENLLTQTEAKFSSNFPSSGNVKVVFESTSNSTGIILCFTVTSTGYLNIELQDENRNPLNAFAFFVGKDAARQFIFDVTGE